MYVSPTGVDKMIGKLQNTQSCAGSERVEAAGAGRYSVYLFYWYKRYEYIYELQSHAGSESVEEAAGAGRRCSNLLTFLVQKVRSLLALLEAGMRKVVFGAQG